MWVMCFRGRVLAAVAHAFLPRTSQSSSLGLLLPQPLLGRSSYRRGASPSGLTRPAPSSTAAPEDLLKQSVSGPFPDQTPRMHSIILQMKNKTPSGLPSLQTGLRLQSNRGSDQAVPPCKDLSNSTSSIAHGTTQRVLESQPQLPTQAGPQASYQTLFVP